MLKLTLLDFVNKWNKAALTERAGAQMHFIELCDVLDQPHPAAEDFSDESYAFEKGVTTTGGGQGFADVWMRGHFAWEYKSKDKPLAAAYEQLLKYREDLQNPPLLVVCDLVKFEVHTNFTGTVKQVYRFALDDLLKNEVTTDCSLPPLDILRAIFNAPSNLRPGRSTAEVTEIAAAEFATVADSLRARGNDPQRSAHFLMRLLFCLFAEDIGLLPPKLFSMLLERTRSRPADFHSRLSGLLAAMATGGSFGADDIAYFNGDLFADSEVLELTITDLDTLLRVSKLDWSSVEPAIFGTLFERSLDPDKRSQLGAHYTSRSDILLIVEPVLMTPLRNRWREVKTAAEHLIENRKSGNIAPKKAQRELRNLLLGFVDELSHIRVLDPACGSGNFLYVALKLLLDLWKEVSVYASTHGLPGLLPYQVTPSQLFGLEKNIYAHELASVVVWIGYIQWLYDNGFGVPASPILQRLDNIRRMDAVLEVSEEGIATQPQWPDADVIIGNPPYVGGNRIRQELGSDYVNSLFSAYQGRISAFSDFVCYWFVISWEMVRSGRAKRVGLLATQSIRGGVNRAVLDQIKLEGDIFMAWSDREWLLEGATVHVALVGFDNGAEKTRQLDGRAVAVINADLTDAIDLTKAGKLAENSRLWTYGSQQKGSFDIPEQTALELLAARNPFGRDNSEVVRPGINGKQLLQRQPRTWVIDFGEKLTATEAALFEAPFEYTRRVVYPERQTRRERRQLTHWWLHARPSPKYRNILRIQKRYIATPVVSKHRVFVWLDRLVLIDHQIVAFAREDDYFFGVLQSRVHELWSRRKGTQVRDAESGFRYTPSTTFETFPMPWVPGAEPESEQLARIASAAKELVVKRELWLNPIGATATELQALSLTNLYNKNPQWLQDLHVALDNAVVEAYGWPENCPDSVVLEGLLEINQQRRKNWRKESGGV